MALGILIFCINRLFFTGAVECPQDLYSLIYEILPYFVAPLILIYIILNRKKRFLKYIFIISGIFAVLIILANVLFFMSNNAPNIIMEFKMFSSMLLSQKFEAVIFLASNYLIIICVASALIYHIRNFINTNAEKAVLENQNRAISQGYDNLINSVKKTNEVRHEWKHDLLTLSLLYDQGKSEEIGNYLHKKIEFLNLNNKIRFTENFVLDTILNSAAAKAKNENVKLTTYLNNIPPKLNIKEKDLCQLLMNMFDNAFNACADVGGEKYINFNAETKNNFLTISCSNSRADVKSKKNTDDLSHGYGIINMRKICQRYGSDLLITETPTEFTVKSALMITETQDGQDQ